MIPEYEKMEFEDMAQLNKWIDDQQRVIIDVVNINTRNGKEVMYFRRSEIG